MIGTTTVVDWVAPPHFAAANIMMLLVSEETDLAMAIEQAVATLS